MSFDQNYRVLRVVARTPIVHPLPQQRDHDIRSLDSLYSTLPKNVQVLHDLAGPYYKSYGCVRSVDISIRKMDHKPVRLYEKNYHWKSTMEHVSAIYDAIFSEVSAASNDEILSRIDWSKSSGMPWVRLGMKKKLDCLNSSRFRLFMFDIQRLIESRPVWKVADKVEWKHITYLLAMKVRTFIIPPLHLLWYQLQLYMHQNAAMKHYHYSAYGFNPYQGGVDRMAQELLVNPTFFWYDVKGWDRLLPIMRDIYRIRNKWVPARFDGLKTWVTDNTCESHILVPGGQVLRKEIGNNSGSGSTTNDNIIGHTLILDYALLNFFDGDRKQVERVVARLFGDDDIGSVNITPDQYGFFESSIRKSFGDFGMELDPFCLSGTLEGAEFLGFKFHNHGGVWVPVYDEERLLASFCYTFEKGNAGKSLTKAWTLTVMSSTGRREVFDSMCLAISHYCDTLRNSVDTVVVSFREMGPPTYEECISFMTGRESSRVPNFFDYEFASWFANRSEVV